MTEQSSSTGVIVGVLIVIVVLIVAYLAYAQGYFTSESKKTDSNGLEIQVGGTSDNSQQ